MNADSLELLEHLDGNLIMRRSRLEDADRLADFNSHIHGDDPYDAAAVAAWTRDLLKKPHPTFGKSDFIIVEDTRTGAIVSSLNLISQTWSYEGIPFGVGRPELVGTDPAYRNRGLVRKQFEAVHQMSQARGELAQAITGIPYFYRQFGYEMGLDLGGGRVGFEPGVPKLEEGQDEPYIIRPALPSDIPFLLEMIERENRRSLVAAVWDEALLRHELLEKSEQNVNRLELRVIETRAGQPVGYLAHPAFTWWGEVVALMLFRYELVETASYWSVTPAVIRYLWKTGQEYARARGRIANGFGFHLGVEHPAYQAAGARLPVTRKPYAFYIRVPDLPAFLQRIAPVLEKRLRESIFIGYSGELLLSFYRSGLRLVWDCGELRAVQPWKTGDGKEAAGFPDLTFLQLVFGYRSLDNLRYAFADCWSNDEAAELLKVLFPMKHSCVWPVS